jgi:photosystem II stability/assembly factor-like uncharacterized protein
MTHLYLLAALAFHWMPQDSNSAASLRGLSVASKKVVWASGSKGTVLRTVDGGDHWQIRKVSGAEALDFRDVVAFDANNALVMASGTGDAARVYLTSDGGEQWTLVLGNPDKTGFFDAMKFWNRKQGMLLGDPVAGHFTILTTENGGLNWVKVKQPPALEGEGAFAASGTCLTLHGGSEAWFGTGGPHVARIFHSEDRGQSWTVASTPLAGETAASGIFSVLFTDERHGLAVGGNYQKPGDPAHTVALSADGGQTWTLPGAGIAGGFRSAVALLKGMKMLIAVGTSGSDYSRDGGLTWHSISNESVNAVASYGNLAWAVGAKGLILKLTIDK